MGCFTSRSRGHVEHALVGLRRECDDRQERGGGLEHVMACQVFGCSTNRYVTLEYLETNIGPLSDRLEVDTTVDECLCEIASSRP